MGLAAEVSVAPGVADDHVPYAGAMRDLLRTPGIAGTALDEELRAALAQSIEDASAEAGWWQALRRHLAPEYHTVTGVDQQAIRLDAYWMTLPDVAGAGATLTVTAEAAVQRSASFTIAGVGGGPKYTLTLKEGLTHETEVPERIQLSTVGTFEHVSVTREGETIARYPRLIAIDERHLEWAFEPAVPPEPDGLGPVVDSRTFDQSRSAGLSTVTLDLARGTTWEVSAGLRLAALGGLKLNLSAQVTYQQAVGLAYRLPPGHRYLAIRYADFPGYAWSLSGADEGSRH